MEISSDEMLDKKIQLSSDNIIKNLSILNSFIYSSKTFEYDNIHSAIGDINKQFLLVDYKTNDQDQKNKIWLSHENILLSKSAIKIFTNLLSQFFLILFDNDKSFLTSENLSYVINKILNILLICSEKCPKFSIEICNEITLLQFYYDIIIIFKKNYLENSLPKDHTEMLISSIGTLYACLTNGSEESISKIRQTGFLIHIKDLIKCSEQEMQITSFLVFAHIANDSESILLKNDMNSVDLILSFVSESLKEIDMQFLGFSTEELLKGIEKLTRNIENKKSFVDCNITKILNSVFQSNSRICQKIALTIYWNIAFDEKCRRLIKKDFCDGIENLKQNLENDKNNGFCAMFARSYNEIESTKESSSVDSTLSKQSSDEIKIPNKEDLEQVMKGASWAITKKDEDEEIYLQAISETGIDRNIPENMQIMISYSHKNKDIVMKIYNALKKENYKLWIDESNIEDKSYIMSSIAQGIEQSNIIIICVSEHYNASQYCHSECDYAFKLQKLLLPVMIQPNYIADGWLGFTLSRYVYYDFSGKKNTFTVEFDKLKNKIEKLALNYNMKVEKNIESSDNVDFSQEKREDNGLLDVNTWTNSSVIQWFNDAGIEKFEWKSHYTGLELNFLKFLTINTTNPFYEICKNDLKILDLKNMRILYENIHKI